MRSGLVNDGSACRSSDMHIWHQPSQGVSLGRDWWRCLSAQQAFQYTWTCYKTDAAQSYSQPCFNGAAGWTQDLLGNLNIPASTLPGAQAAAACGRQEGGTRFGVMATLNPLL